MKGIFSLFCFIVFIINSPNIAAQENTFVLRVMNYNIKGLPLPWIKHKKRFKNISEQLGMLAQKGNAPHILNLQEAITKKSKKISKFLDYPFKVRGPKGKGLRVNGGLETLSQFKMVETNTWVYSRCVSFDCFARKGVLHTRIEIPGVPALVDVYSTHMNAGPTGDPFTPRWKTREIREHQAMEMREFINQTHDPKNLLLAIGDFNFRPSEDTYWSFTTLLDLNNSAYDCGIVYRCAGSNDAYYLWTNLIDHQFYKGTDDVDMTPVYFDKILRDETNGKVLSDHDAVYTYYELTW